MKNLFIALATFVLAAGLYASAHADPPTYAQTVTSCGTPNNTPVVGNAYPITQDTTGKLCTGATSSGTSTVTVTNLPTTVDTNTGAAGASTLRVVPATGSTTAVTQATAANLNATVVGTGTFAVQAAVSAGTNLIGKVGIDQTTPGTTNGIEITGNSNSGNLSTQSYVISASNLPVAGVTLLNGGSGQDPAAEITGVTAAGIGAVAVVAAPTTATNAGITPIVSSAVETGHVLKNSAGNLYAFAGTSGASAGEFLIHNSTTVPGAGAVTPVECFVVPANTTISVVFNPPDVFATGISASFSTATTCFTQTNSSTAFFSGKIK